MRPTVDKLNRDQEELAKRYKAERVPFDFGCIKEVHRRAVGLAKYSLLMIDKSFKSLSAQVCDARLESCSLFPLFAPMLLIGRPRWAIWGVL